MRHVFYTITLLILAGCAITSVPNPPPDHPYWLGGYTGSCTDDVNFPYYFDCRNENKR